MTPGWGSTASCPATTSTVLLEVEVPIVSDSICEAASSDSVTQSSNGQCVTGSASYSGAISSEMVCAGSSGKDSCQGDSGGPFTVKSSSTNQHDLVGVVSWGYGCAAVSKLFFFLSFHSFLRMDCMVCTRRLLSLGHGLTQRLPPMEGQRFARCNILDGQCFVHCNILEWQCFIHCTL